MLCQEIRSLIITHIKWFFHTPQSALWRTLQQKKLEARSGKGAARYNKKTLILKTIQNHIEENMLNLLLHASLTITRKDFI